MEQRTLILAYEARAKRLGRRIVRWWHGLEEWTAIFICLSFALYVCLYVRSLEFGLSFKTMLFGLGVGGVLMIIPLVICPQRRPFYRRACLYVALASIPVGMSEVWCVSEELAAMSEARRNPTVVFVVQRRWPFSGISILYIPASGWQVAD